MDPSTFASRWQQSSKTVLHHLMKNTREKWWSWRVIGSGEKAMSLISCSICSSLSMTAICNFAGAVTATAIGGRTASIAPSTGRHRRWALALARARASARATTRVRRQPMAAQMVAFMATQMVAAQEWCQPLAAAKPSRFWKDVSHTSGHSYLVSCICRKMVLGGIVAANASPCHICSLTWAAIGQLPSCTRTTTSAGCFPRRGNIHGPRQSVRRLQLSARKERDGGGFQVVASRNQESLVRDSRWHQAISRPTSGRTSRWQYRSVSAAQRGIGSVGFHMQGKHATRKEKARK